MKHVGRILTAVLVVFALAVVWYARSGEAVVTRRVFTNAASIAEGTIWVRSDKGLFGGPVTAIANLSSDGAVVYRPIRREVGNGCDGPPKKPLVRSHPDRSLSDACSIGEDTPRDDGLA